MPRIHWSLGKLTALCTLPAVLFVLAVQGHQMLSPGPMNSHNRTGKDVGGVRSHADLAQNCAACHASPLSGQTMTSRCLDCHASIRQQIETKQSLHGRMPQQDCRGCHTEHHGSNGKLTSFANFDHDWCNFALAGKHEKVQCIACHKNQEYRGTAQQCASCHAEPISHKGQFGLNCIQCHSPHGWDAVSFRHAFPINHGGAMKKGQGCATCHTEKTNYKQYTCYNCHRHQPENTAKRHARMKIENLNACATCHTFGRRGKKVAEEEQPLEWRAFLEGERCTFGTKCLMEKQ